MSSTFPNQLDELAAPPVAALQKRVGVLGSTDASSLTSQVIELQRSGGGGGGPWGQASTSKFSGSGSPIGVVTPSGIGDLYVDDTTPALWQATGLTSSDWSQQGGTSVQGASIVRKFPFAFDTPDILTGAALYTPTVGDILLDAWIEIDTAWDGTTPLGDMGAFIGGNQGWFNFNLGFTIDMTTADSQNPTGLLTGPIGGSAANGGIYGGPLSQVGSVNDVSLGFSSQVGGGALTQNSPARLPNRQAPAKISSAGPIKVCVSQDGTNTGADPGSTQGAAILYLVTATPA